MASYPTDKPGLKRRHEPGWQHVPPDPGSRGYIRVVARGCGGTRDYWGEYDCSHKYTWACDDCPIVVEKQSEEPSTPEPDFTFL